MSREEKEQYVIRLYKEGKTIREIAKIMHMSFGGIGAITRKVKLQADGADQLKDDDIKSKSKFAQAMNLFSELESPVDVAITLDLSADEVKGMYLQYWELKGMYGLALICEENRYDVHDLLKLHKIAKDHGMEKQDIINALEFAKHGQLRTMRWEAANLRYQINKLETEKVEAMERLLKFKRIIGESEDS